MKKALLATAVIGLAITTPAQAASVYGFKIGGDIWHTEPSGDFQSDKKTVHVYDFDSELQGSVWVSFEHPVTFLPNIKLRENRLDSNGQGVSDLTFNGIDLKGNSTAYNEVNNTDLILYYEILDNDVLSLDLGAAYKLMHGSFGLSGTTGVDDSNISTQKDVSSGVIMGYAQSHIGVPGTGLFGFVEIQLGINETGIHDYQAGIGWQFDRLVVDTSARLGYRSFTIDVKNFSGVTQNMTFDGLFAGVELTF